MADLGSYGTEGRHVFVRFARNAGPFEAFGWVGLGSGALRFTVLRWGSIF